MKWKLLSLLLIIVALKAKASEVIELRDDNVSTSITIGKSIEYFEDKLGEVQIKNIDKIVFEKSTSSVPNFGISSSTYWLKFTLLNKSQQTQFLLNFSQPITDNVTFYYPNNNTLNKYDSIKAGESLPFKNRKYTDPNFLFDIDISSNQTKIYYLKISSREAIQIPLNLGTKKVVINELKLKDLLSGIYVGIMLVMILYNLFIYFSVRDKSYIYYVLYISIVLLTQTIIQGYPFQFLWPNNPIVAQYSFFIIPILVGIVSLTFMNVFLKTKEFTPKLYKLSFFFILPYLISLIFAVFGKFEFSLPLMEISAGIVSFFMLYVSIIILKKRYQPAKYFVVAWSIFLCGVIIYVLKDFEVLPFNNFTRYTMQIGSGIETVLLSFALAARINIYKKERLEAVEEKERVLKEQNIILEQKVDERTKELNDALRKLKDTQVQLVDAEKMSALGQLTAGIAHEINNPINFVSSNIAPLRQDLDDIQSILNKYEELNNENITKKLEEIKALKQNLDYEYLKTELISIVDGIEDGAKRTTEIVSGLRNFSRLDEGEMKKADLNVGITSSLVLIKNKLDGIKVETSLEENVLCEGNHGKLNQLIVNLIDNSIYAIKKKHKDYTQGLIKIITKKDTDNVTIQIEDNGIGIPEDIRSKIFDPFFTTKDVGEGTGLGLAIVRGIIENHNGKIELESKSIIGTIIKITLPKNQP